MVEKTTKPQNLIWWLIKKQNNWWSQLLGLVGFVALFWIILKNPWSVVAMLLGIYLHEFGHYAIFVYNGIKSIIIVIFPLGAVAAPINQAEDARSDLLPWWNIAWLLQAGPTMNVILIIVGQALIQINFLPQLGTSLVYINGLLAITNLLPIGNLDGGQLIKVIYSSLEEKAGKVIAIAGTSAAFAIIFGVLITSAGQLYLSIVLQTLLQNFYLIIFLVLFASGIWHKQTQNNPLLSKSSQAMSIKQAMIHLSFYSFLIILTLLLFK